jgi:uncharacterized protein YkwD
MRLLARRHPTTKPPLQAIHSSMSISRAPLSSVPSLRRLAVLLPILLALTMLPPSGAAAADPAAPQQVMLDAVNAVRAANGLPALYWDTRLATAAGRHAADLQGCGRLSHTGCDGSDLAARLRLAGYAYRAGAENLALCACDAAEAVRLLMDSAGHRRNLLNADVAALGADRRPDTGDPRRVLWVLVLGRPATE